MWRDQTLEVFVFSFRINLSSSYFPLSFRVWIRSVLLRNISLCWIWVLVKAAQRSRWRSIHFFGFFAVSVCHTRAFTAIRVQSSKGDSNFRTFLAPHLMKF
jgi:hypothetical protein